MNQKDLKRYKKMLEDSKLALLQSAKKTLMEESNFDTDDLPDEIDLASSEYTQSMVFRLRDREKFLLKKIDKALARIEDGTFGLCERCEEPISAKRLEARPVTATTSKLVYTLTFDNSMLPDDAARTRDLAQKRAQFEGALANMKIIAEGGALPPPAPRPAAPAAK